MNDKSKERKRLRLPAYSYTAGCYFVTICTKDRRCFLADIQPTVGADDSVRPYGVSSGHSLVLTPIGEIARDCMEKLASEADGITIDKYVIMPNHVHVLLQIAGDEGGQSRPPLQRVMQRYKSITTRQCWPLGVRIIWQRSFYDHVVRNERDYLRIWQYIEENPMGWTEDIYYEETT